MNKKSIEIRTVEDLLNIKNDLSGNYIQMNDIDMSNASDFIPIGDVNHSFTGTYNGDNYTIKNLTLNCKTKDYIGLFGRTDNAKLINIKLKNTHTTGNFYVGSLLGYGYKTLIKNCHTHSTVRGLTFVGGLAGVLSTRSIIEKSSSKGSVGLKKDSSVQVGGIVGSNRERSRIVNCYSVTNVKGEVYLGGISGSNTNRSSIISSYSDSFIIDGMLSGGIVGLNSNSNCINCAWSNNKVTKGVGDYKKGIFDSTPQNSSRVNKLIDKLNSNI